VNCLIFDFQVNVVLTISISFNSKLKILNHHYTQLNFVYLCHSLLFIYLIMHVVAIKIEEAKMFH